MTVLGAGILYGLNVAHAALSSTTTGTGTGVVPRRSPTQPVNPAHPSQGQTAQGQNAAATTQQGHTGQNPQAATAAPNTEPKNSVTVTFTTGTSHPLSASAKSQSDANTDSSSTSTPATPSESGQSGQSGQLPAKVVLSVPAQDQLPALPNGCEVTSLSMLFTAIGHPVSNITLANEEPTDPTPLVRGPNNTIAYWGNPNIGFVGNVRGYGYGIYHGPIVKLINQILPGRALDLTGQPFSAVLSKVAQGVPVMVWTTANFEPEPASQWVTWNSPEGPVHATMWEHAVLVVGYDANHIYINDPLDGAKAKPVLKSDFVAAWKQMGQQAVTILPVSQ